MFRHFIFCPSSSQSIDYLLYTRLYGSRLLLQSTQPKMAQAFSESVPQRLDMSQSVNSNAPVRAASEKKMGLLFFTSTDQHGWHGEIRKRYTDFLVNEIRKDGKVLHLEDYTIIKRPDEDKVGVPRCVSQMRPKSNKIFNNQKDQTQTTEVQRPASIAEDDVAILKKLLGDATASSLLALHDRITEAGTAYVNPQANALKFPPMERDERAQTHQVSRSILLLPNCLAPKYRVSPDKKKSSKFGESSHPRSTRRRTAKVSSPHCRPTFELARNLGAAPVNAQTRSHSRSWAASIFTSLCTRRTETRWKQSTPSRV